LKATFTGGARRNTKPMNQRTNTYPLTEDQIRQIESLTGEPDTTDMPEASEDAWKSAQGGVFFKPSKDRANSDS